MISLHLRGAKLMISIHLRGAKLYDPPPLRVQIYLGRFFKRSFLYGVYVFETSKELIKILGKTFYLVLVFFYVLRMSISF